MTVPRRLGQFACPPMVRQLRTLAAFLGLLLAAPVLAQEPPPHLTLSHPIATVPVASDKPAPLTEIEQLKVQVINLEGAIVRRAVEDWQQKVAKLKADLEATRPGFRWIPETGAWEAVSQAATK